MTKGNSRQVIKREKSTRDNQNIFCLHPIGTDLLWKEDGGLNYSRQYLETFSSMGTGYFPLKQAKQRSSLGIWEACSK